MNTIDHREMVRSAVEAEYPKLSLHSVGAACSPDDDWDLGFFVDGQSSEDGRSLELRGAGDGHVRSEIIKNYRGRGPDEPAEVIRWPVATMQKGDVLPPPLRAACDAMVAAA